MGQTCNHLEQMYKQEDNKHNISHINNPWLDSQNHAESKVLNVEESCWICLLVLMMHADLITCVGSKRYTNTKHYLKSFFWRNMKVFFSHVTHHHNYVSGRCCLLTNIHGKYSWIQRYSRGCGWHRPAAVANKSSDKSALWKSTNPEFGNPQIHTKAVHKCSLWKIVTKADSAKLAQKLSWVSAVPSRQPPSA